jgi:hypothetical protein
MRKYSNGILLLDGLYGNVLGSVEKDFEASDCPVFILTDKAEKIVGYCMGQCLEEGEPFCQN